MLPGTNGCILVADRTNQRSGSELDDWPVTVLLFSCSWQLTPFGVLCFDALGHRQSGGGPMRKLRGNSLGGVCARELPVIELWVLVIRRVAEDLLSQSQFFGVWTSALPCAVVSVVTGLKRVSRLSAPAV